jgi:hypothetical protein
MLADRNAIATIPVRDAKVAKRFILLYQSGTSTVLVYESAYAGTNRATTATWSVGEELETIVDALRAKGCRPGRKYSPYQ